MLSDMRLRGVTRGFDEDWTLTEHTALIKLSQGKGLPQTHVLYPQTQPCAKNRPFSQAQSSHFSGCHCFGPLMGLTGKCMEIAVQIRSGP